MDLEKKLCSISLAFFPLVFRYGSPFLTVPLEHVIVSELLSHSCEAIGQKEGGCANYAEVIYIYIYIYT